MSEIRHEMHVILKSYLGTAPSISQRMELAGLPRKVKVHRKKSVLNLTGRGRHFPEIEDKFSGPMQVCVKAEFQNNFKYVS